MDIAHLIIPLVAIAASLVTLISGFGLGTLLLPVFALFFPVEVAILLTAVVHLLNRAHCAASSCCAAGWARRPSSLPVWPSPVWLTSPGFRPICAVVH
jgi:uncharacterized membrane protein YfcA